MSLRSKTIIIGVITVVAVLLIVNIIGHFIIIGGFEKLEVQSMEKSVKNARAFINEEKNSLDLSRHEKRVRTSMSLLWT
jgi:sensor domain CHASE-containing protein